MNIDVAESDKTSVVLQPGEMSLHHGQTIHGSQPNRSNDRRIGFAIRYINPEAVQQSVSREYAMLARGADISQHFIHYAKPKALLCDNSLKIYEQIRAHQDKVLGAGLPVDQTLYS